MSQNRKIRIDTASSGDRFPWLGGTTVRMPIRSADTGGFDRFVLDIGRPPRAGEAPPPTDADDVRRMLEITPRYGVEMRPDLTF